MALCVTGIKLVFDTDTTSNDDDNDSSDNSDSKTIRVTGVETQSSIIDNKHGVQRHLHLHS
jgi:hypothetical protein